MPNRRRADWPTESSRRTIGAGLACILITCGVLYGVGGKLRGVVLLGLGVQAALISNQSRINAVRPEARSRINTAYMFAYFVGGAAGSSCVTWVWSLTGWGGVRLAGAEITTLGLLAFVSTAPGAEFARPGSRGSPVLAAPFVVGGTMAAGAAVLSEAGQSLRSSGLTGLTRWQSKPASLCLCRSGQRAAPA